MIDPKEAHVIADVIARQLCIRAGALRPFGGIDQIARSAPRLFHELMEDAELIIAALDTHRRRQAALR